MDFPLGTKDKGRKRSRSYDTFLVPSTDQSEWLVGHNESFQLVMELLAALEVSYKARIFVPGVGLSELPRRLFDAGFYDLTLFDIEEGRAPEIVFC